MGEKTIDLQTPLFNFEGEPMLDERSRQATLRSVAVNALMTSYESEKSLSGEEKMKRFELAWVLQRANAPVRLKAEEVVMLKGLIAKGYGAIIVGQTFQILEGETSYLDELRTLYPDKKFELVAAEKPAEKQSEKEDPAA